MGRSTGGGRRSAGISVAAWISSQRLSASLTGRSRAAVAQEGAELGAGRLLLLHRAHY
jgi:hypothetical protein